MHYSDHFILRCPETLSSFEFCSWFCPLCGHLTFDLSLCLFKCWVVSLLHFTLLSLCLESDICYCQVKTFLFMDLQIKTNLFSIYLRIINLVNLKKALRGNKKKPYNICLFIKCKSKLKLNDLSSVVISLWLHLIDYFKLWVKKATLHRISNFIGLVRAMEI